MWSSWMDLQSASVFKKGSQAHREEASSSGINFEKPWEACRPQLEVLDSNDRQEVQEEDREVARVGCARRGLLMMCCISNQLTQVYILLNPLCHLGMSSKLKASYPQLGFKSPLVLKTPLRESPALDGLNPENWKYCKVCLANITELL